MTLNIDLGFAYKTRKIEIIEGKTIRKNATNFDDFFFSFLRNLLNFFRDRGRKTGFLFSMARFFDGGSQCGQNFHFGRRSSNVCTEIRSGFTTGIQPVF